MAMIVKVTEHNIDAAGYIHSESWKESHRTFCTAQFIEKHTPAAQAVHLRRQMAEGKQLYMLIDGCPVGIISVHGNLIENLYVLPAEQHKGYGSQLLKYAIQKCQGTPALWVLSNNQKAVRLYLQNGFRETGRRTQLSKDLYEYEMALNP